MGYPTLDITAPDTDKEVLCPGCDRLSIQVSNQAVYITFGQGTPMALYDTPEVFLPTVGTVVRNFDAYKVRAYIPSSQLGAVPQAHVQLRPLPAGA